MSRLILFGTVVAALLLAFVGWRTVGRSRAQEGLLEVKAKPPPPAMVCPWREPEADLKRLFPTATRYEAETRILSALRVELAERLGRPPTGEEMALRIYRIYADRAAVGTVLTRRVKGAHGAIELVLAVDPDERVRGLRLQRLREPEPVALALAAPDWLRWFEGKGVDSSWDTAGALSESSPEGRMSAEAIVEGAHSLMVLLAAAGNTNAHSSTAHSHH